MAEQKEQPGSSLPQPEWKHDFSPGPSEEEIKRFQGPEWRSKLPDIRMQEPIEGAAGDKAASEAQQRMLAEMMQERLFGRESSFGKFIKDIKSLKGLEGDERGKVIERVEASYQELTQEQLDEISELQDYEFRLHNPYPYDSRWGLEYFNNLKKQAERTLRQAVKEIQRRGEGAPKEEEEGYDEESLKWLRRLKRDVLWAESTFRIVEGLGPSMDFYYDGELQLKTLRTVHSKITTTDLEGAFSGKLRGEVGEVAKEREGTREIAIKYQDDDAFWRMAIASAAQWDYDNPPKEYKKPTDEEEKKRKREKKPRGTLRNMALRPEELKFIQKVFTPVDKDKISVKYTDKNGTEHEVPESILNFYSSATTEEAMTKYKTRLEALLVIGARDVLDLIKNDEPENIKRKKIEDLVKKVEAYEEEQKKQRKSPEARDLKSRIAESVVRSGILLDWGLMTSGELGWHWEYKLEEMKTDEEFREEKDRSIEERERKFQEELKKKLLERGYKPRKKGEVVSTDKIKEDVAKRTVEEREREMGRKLTPEEKKRIEDQITPEQIVKEGIRDVFLTRTSEIGGIYGAFDVQTVMFWARHTIDYDAMSETRSSLMPPTIGEWRAHWPDHSPYWLPDIRSRNDVILDEVLDLIKGEKGKHLRNQEAIQTGPEGAPIHFGDLHPSVEAFMNETQWFYVTPFYNQHKSGDYLMTFPVFFPTDINFLNFWRNVAVSKESGKFAKTTETLSVWEELLARGRNLSQFDWSLIGPHVIDWYHVNLDMTQRWLGLIVNPHQFNQQSTAEFEKFFEKPSTGSIKELAKRIRLGSRGYHVPRGVLEICIIPYLITLSTINKHNLMDRKTWLKTEAVNAWEEEIAEWVNAALNLPGSKSLDTDAIAPYGNSLALMIFAYATLVRRYAVAAADQMGEEVRQTTAYIKGKWRDVLRSRFTP